MRLVVFVLLLFSFMANAQTSSGNVATSDPPMKIPSLGRPAEIFVDYCVANFVTSGFKIDQVLQSIGAKEYKDDQVAKDYLEGKKGRVWQFGYKGDDYFIAVTSYTCKLYSWYGDREQAWSDFDKFTDLMFSPRKKKELIPTRIYKDGPTFRNSKGVYYDAPPIAISPAFTILTDYSGSKRQPAIQFQILWDETRKLDEINELAHKKDR